MELPSTAPVQVRDQLDLASLVAYLRRDSRERPVVILTLGPGAPSPYVSAAQLAAEARGGADIVTIPTDELTRALSSRLDDPRAGVFRGACRVYPAGNSWETNPLTFPVRMARDAAEINALPRLIIADLRRELDRPATVPAATQPPPGTNAGHPGQRAGKPPRTPPVPAPKPTAGPPPAPLATPTEISTAAEASALASHLRSAARTRPAVVVSRATAAAEPYADVAQLRHDLSGLADVFEICTPDASWAFSHHVPDMCQVYGGACRAYPVGTGWEADPYESPLRFAHGMTDRGQVTRQLIADAMGMASRGSHTAEARPTGASPVSGVVSGLVAGRALVNIDGQFPGTLWPELVEPGLPAERLFVKGMRVQGTLDPETRRIDARTMRRTADEALSSYHAGETILGRVTEIAKDGCTVELFPGFQQPVAASDITDDTIDLRWMMSVGEVLPVWFGGHDDGDWLLSIRDAGELTDAVPAPSLLTGGPPWLVPADPEERRPEPASGHNPDAGNPASLAVTAGVLEGLRKENEQLTVLLQQASATVAELEAELTKARTLRREAVRRRATDSDDANLFADEADQLNFEIRLAWARMTQPSEKAELPLKEWTYGEQFFHTLHAVQGVARSKIVRVIVHILTGLDTELASRELHQLRSGGGGDDAPVVRAGGESCWRVSLQTKTPAARRLHYWMRADGSIELSSIRLHDDFRP
ncbi:MAG: hypothetical protein QM695_02205 [Micropruina sp.]